MVTRTTEISVNVYDRVSDQVLILFFETVSVEDDESQTSRSNDADSSFNRNHEPDDELWMKVIVFFNREW